MAVNYTDQENISIDDINDTPISTGHGHTFGSVFGALNKIIKAIINKFKNVDSEIITLHQGITGSASWSIDNVKPGETAIKIITVDPNHYFTHGYIYINTQKSIYHITKSHSMILENYYGDVLNPDDSRHHYGHADISFAITHENNGTFIKVTFKSLTSYRYDFKLSNFNVRYELY